MTPTQRHTAQIAANDSVRLCFSLTAGLIIGSALIAFAVYCIRRFEIELEEGYQFRGVSPEQERRDETKRCERLARRLVLQTRRASVDDLHDLADMKSEAA